MHRGTCFPGPLSDVANPNECSLYAGISGAELTFDEFDFGQGITLRKTFAHIAAPYLAAFTPTEPGKPHPPPWKAVSGGTIVLEGDELVPEAGVMRRLALEMGLPDEVIIVENCSLSTFENAYYSRLACQELGVKSVLLVTSAYHSRRARRIFREALESEISVSVHPASRGHQPLLWWLHPDQAYVVLYEYKNWIQYWFTRNFDT